MVISFFGLIIDWLITRDWRRVAVGIIPFSLLVTVLVLTVLGRTTNKEILANEYLAAGAAELQSATRDWEFTLGTTDTAAADSQGKARYAEALFQRALDLQSNNKHTRFVVGALLGNRGAIPQALAYMNSIAPAVGSGHPPAHAWIANLMLRSKLTEADMALLKHHLDVAVKWEQVPANLLVAATQFAIQANDNLRAVDLMQQSPELKVELFRVALKIDNKGLADKTADEVLPNLLEKIAAGTATSKDRVDAADILFYTGKLQAARETLEVGLKQEGLAPDDSAKLKLALSELYRQQFTKTLKATTDSWSADIRLLDQAMRIDPTNPKVAEQVAMLARIGGNSPPDELMTQLKEFLAQGTATPVTHAWMAEAHILRKEYGDAIKHLEDVVARMPDSGHSHNNLAYAIALSDPTKMQEALDHAMAAVKAGPRFADFHDTLGFIYMKLNRTAEAISEMEIAIELQPGRPDFHERLAEAYAKQGTKEMAVIHEQLAAKYKEEIAAQAKK